MALLRHIGRVIPSQLRFSFNPSAAVLTRGLKSHTGIAGLDVDPNARENLKSQLQKVLEAIKVIPEETDYRRNVEATINHKLGIVNSDITDEEAEDELDAQLEQYIKFTHDELELIPKMAGRQSQLAHMLPHLQNSLLFCFHNPVWAPWDVPAGHKARHPLSLHHACKLSHIASWV